MRIAIVSESFLPQVNGVTNTVRHVARRLVETGHQPLVIAPGPGDDHHLGVPVVRVRSLPLPRYKSFPVGLPDQVVAQALADFRPDVVHLASPAVVGYSGLRAARRLGIPTVAVFQTDLAGFARGYHLRADAPVWAWLRRIHSRADRTLAPTPTTMQQLQAHGVPRVHVWGRGVDLGQFDPRRRTDRLREWLAPNGELLVGYVGRLAAEKQVRRLAAVTDIPGTRLVVVGEGPERPWLERSLSGAVFLGLRQGDDLAEVFASLDVFAHTGTYETYCQAVQEAQASGVAVVAPGAGGPLDLVEHGRTGVLYEPSDPYALRRAVVAVARDDAFRDRLADGGRAAVAGRSWDRLVDDLVDRHYATLVAGTPARAA
ncbi:MAG: glycosyltransferase family 4 protein [Nocardioidaceae bacterium]